MIRYMNSKSGHIVTAFFDGHQWRVLGLKKSVRLKAAVNPFLVYLESAGVPVIPASQIPDFDWTPTDQSSNILDQMQVGSCVAHAHCKAMEVSRSTAGMSYVALSADSLYAQIDNDVDQGSNPADAITALATNGICTLADVPDNFVLWSSISGPSKQTALRFRIMPIEVYSINSFDELATAIYLRFATTLTVNVGGSFTPDPTTGLVNFTPGVANHCVFGGTKKSTLSGGTPVIFPWNSWNSSWGINGRFAITAEFIDQQPEGQFYAIKSALSDPLDPNNPPTL